MISHHSLYAFKDTIINGFISLGNGIRIGLIGRASIENKAIIGIYDISEFAIRLPNKILLSCENIIELSRNNSILIYSPPGIGKTTLLRNLVFELSKGYNAKRIAVIDTRGELAYGLEDSELLVSILSLYPRRTGIEIAVRTMNAQIIVCDEIGNLEDSAAIIEAQGAGVPIIASCHGKSIQDILSHNGIRNLHDHHIFEYYIGIERTKNHQFNYNITNWREVKLDYN
jgi:stage III sporulation protein AA